MINKVTLNLELEVSDEVYKLIWNESAIDLRDKRARNIEQIINKLEINKNTMCVLSLSKTQEENKGGEISIDMKQVKVYILRPSNTKGK